MGKKNLLAGIMFSLALIIAIVFAGCDLEGATPDVVDAETPNIVSLAANPGAQVEPGTAFTLTVTASVADGGSLKYEWYRLTDEYDDLDGTPGTALEGTNTLSVLGLQAGVYNYYVVVTNENPGVLGNKTASSRSDLITIISLSGTSPIQYPKITEQPVGRTYMAGVEINLAVTTEPVADAGVAVSYQWYSARANSNKGGDIIDGATGRVLTLSSLTNGTYFYYVVITNALDDAALSITSHVAAVEIISELTPNATITVSPNRKKQYVRGFGGMDTFWGNFTSIELDEYEKMYNPVTGLGFNMLRIMIMPEAEDTGSYDINDIMDYYLNGIRPNSVEGVKIVNQYGGYVLASPWTPPPHMKSNGIRYGGGHLLPNYWDDYADFLRAYCQWMYDAGAPIYVVSIQNEPNYTARDYDGCEWDPEPMRDFFKQQGRFTQAGGPRNFATSIPGYGGGKAHPYVFTMNGESANNPNINDAAMNDPDSRKYIDYLGRHIYGSEQTRYANALDHPTDPKEVWQTEHNINSSTATAFPNDYTWNYVWKFMNDVDLSIRLNDESAFIWWALRRFYSFIGEGDYGSVNGAILPRGYAFSHYAKFAKEMWRIDLAASGTTGDGKPITASNFNSAGFNVDSVSVKAVAFISEDGNTLSYVLFTPTNPRGANGVDMGTVELKLPAGFTARTATAMRSTATAKAKTEGVIMNEDNTSAYIMLPPSSIVSVRFEK